MLALLPWAERGELAEALILLRARFPPLKPELLQAARDLVAQTPAAERIAAANDLPADLRRDLARPLLKTELPGAEGSERARPLRLCAASWCRSAF